MSRNQDDCTVWECAWTVNLPSLKTLEIAVFANPSVNAFKLISGCPILETLSLEVFMSEEGEEYIFNIPTLKHLLLTLVFVNDMNVVVLNLPNLEYLFLGLGELPMFFVMEDVSSLVEASLSYKYLSLDHVLVELFNGLSGVETFSVEHEPNFDCSAPFILPLPAFPNLKHLELKCFWHSGLIHHFLESSPHLKHLCIENLDDENYKVEEFNWVEQKLVAECMLSSLTTLKFSKCEGEKCEEYMLGNAEVLKTVTITWHNICFEEQMRLGGQLLKVPRASEYCEISFLGNSSQSTESLLLEP